MRAQVWTGRDGVDVGSFRLTSNPHVSSSGQQTGGRRLDRFLKSAYAKSRADVSPAAFPSGDKRWVKRAESADGSHSDDLLHDAVARQMSSTAVVTSTQQQQQQYAFIRNEELEALVRDGRPLDVRESLPATALETDPSHLLSSKEVDTIHRMLDVFLRGFAVLAAELTAHAVDQPATLAKIWITFCRSAEAHFAAKYASELAHFIHHDRIHFAQKKAEARELSRKVHGHEQEKAVIEQRFARVLAEQRRIADEAAATQREEAKWRMRAEEASRARDEIARKLGTAQSRIESLKEALTGLSQLVEVASDRDDVREQLEAEYGAELQRLQALISAAQQEAANAMAREREIRAAEELTRREKRRAQADASELRDTFQRMQQDFKRLQVSMVEERAKAEAALSSANRELSVMRVVSESAQRDVAQAQVEIAQERQRTKAALQAEAEQVGRTRDSAMKASERECDLTNERARVRLAEAGRQAAEEAARVLQKQLEGAQRSLLLYRAATAEKSAAQADPMSTRLATAQQELAEASAFIQVMTAENDKMKKEAADMRNRLASSQEGDVEHARALAIVAADMDASHGKMREAQRVAAVATAELETTKNQVAECIASTQEAKKTAADASAALETETRIRMRVEDELGAANAQLADALRLVRELKAAQKEQGVVSDDMMEARVALAEAREEVDALRLRLSGFELEERAAMGGPLKTQKEREAQLEAARTELSSIYKLGKSVVDGVESSEDAVDGVEPSEEAPVDASVALEAVEAALSDLQSRNSQWRDKVNALEKEIGRKDEQARVAIAALTAEKEEVEARVEAAESNAIREMDIMHEEVGHLEGRVNRLRVELVDNVSIIRSILDDVGQSPSTLSCPDPGTANDQDIFSSAREHVNALRASVGTVTMELETYAEQCTALTAASVEAKVTIANLEVELRTIGEASEEKLRDREDAVAEMNAAKEAVSGMEARLTAAEERAQRFESLLNKPVKTLGTQAGAGLREPKPKPHADRAARREAAIKSHNTMDCDHVPEHVDNIVPREPPPPPRTGVILKPPPLAGWGSTWATAPRTRPSESPPPQLLRSTTSAMRRRDASPLRGFETAAADRLGLRRDFEWMASHLDGRGDGYYGVDESRDDDAYGPVVQHRAARVVSETNPRPLVKADDEGLLRPRTSPALTGSSMAAGHQMMIDEHRAGNHQRQRSGRGSSREFMHAALVQRRELLLPIGTIQLSGDEAS